MPENMVRLRLMVVLLASAMVAEACWAQTSGPASKGEPITTEPRSIAMSPADVSATPSESPDLSSLCQYTLPPSRAAQPVPGISIRSIDKAHIEIANATSRTYYYRVAAWVVYDNLVCGRGILDTEMALSPIGAGETTLVGVMEDVPITVDVWDRSCGEGCTRHPIATVIVPMSSLEPPPPEST